MLKVLHCLAKSALASSSISTVIRTNISVLVNTGIFFMGVVSTPNIADIYIYSNIADISILHSPWASR